MHSHTRNALGNHEDYPYIEIERDVSILNTFCNGVLLSRLRMSQLWVRQADLHGENLRHVLDTACLRMSIDVVTDIEK
jgi:hypothetical protein